MTSKERIMAVLKGKEPDRLPWAPLMDEYYTKSLAINGKIPDTVDVAREIGADIMERHVQTYNVIENNIERKFERNGDKELETIITPVGILKQHYSYSGETRFDRGHRVNTLEDIKVLQYIFENTNYELMPKSFLERQAYIKDDGIATVTVNSSPIEVLTQGPMGLENFTYNLYDNEKEVKELMEVIYNTNLKQLKKLIESPAEVIINYEDTSTTVLSDKWYKEFVSGYINECADLVHKSGKIYITHMCGKLKGFVNIIKNDRMDGIDSVCPPTTGDLWAHEALESFNGKFIIGGIEPSALKRMTVDETEKYVMKILKEVAPWKNFILSTGDATSFGTPIENLKKVSELIRKYGTYPIEIQKG